MASAPVAAARMIAPAPSPRRRADARPPSPPLSLSVNLEEQVCTCGSRAAHARHAAAFRIFLAGIPHRRSPGSCRAVPLAAPSRTPRACGNRNREPCRDRARFALRPTPRFSRPPFCSRQARAPCAAPGSSPGVALARIRRGAALASTRSGLRMSARQPPSARSDLTAIRRRPSRRCAPARPHRANAVRSWRTRCRGSAPRRSPRLPSITPDPSPRRRAGARPPSPSLSTSTTTRLTSARSAAAPCCARAPCSRFRSVPNRFSPRSRTAVARTVLSRSRLQHHVEPRWRARTASGSRALRAAPVASILSANPQAPPITGLAFARAVIPGDVPLARLVASVSR